MEQINGDTIEDSAQTPVPPPYRPAWTETNPSMILLATFGLCMGFAFLGVVLMLVVLLAYHIDFNLMLEGNMAAFSENAPVMRWIIAVNHLTTFVLPGVVVLWLFYRYYSDRLGRGWMHYLGVLRHPGWLAIGLGILLTLVSLPLTQYLYTLNKMLPLPDWMRSMETDTAATLKAILSNMTPTTLAVNILLIAVLPAIGEELIFRGIVQRQMMRYVRQPWVAIAISGAIFSFIHLQFEGFFARWVLGAVLGWLYWRSGNLWVPIAAHFFNNAFMVAGVYFIGGAYFDVENEANVDVPWWAALLSVFLMAVIVRFFLKTVAPENPALTNGPGPS